MAESPDAAACRLSVSPEDTQRELRLCAFELLNHFLSLQHVLAENLRLQPVDMLIILATTTGNVQRALRNETLPDLLRSSQSLPPEMVVPVSRRAIARITGLPTETVRRHVDALIQNGMLVAMPKGVRAPNRMTERWVQGAVLQMLGSLADCTEKMMALQTIALHAPKASPHKRT